VSHVGDQGEEAARLPPPKQDIPKAVEASDSAARVVGSLLKNLGAL
jgi:hypothetical protein